MDTGMGDVMPVAASANDFFEGFLELPGDTRLRYAEQSVASSELIVGVERDGDGGEGGGNK